MRLPFETCFGAKFEGPCAYETSHSSPSHHDWHHKVSAFVLDLKKIQPDLAVFPDVEQLCLTSKAVLDNTGLQSLDVLTHFRHLEHNGCLRGSIVRVLNLCCSPPMLGVIALKGCRGIQPEDLDSCKRNLKRQRGLCVHDVESVAYFHKAV